MKRFGRILLIGAAGLVLLIAGLALAAALIPEARVAAVVADRAEAALGHPVAIEGVGVTILPPGVRLTGFALGGTDSTALARVDRVKLRVRLLPLVRGQVVVASLNIDGPRIAVEIDDAGVANFPVIEPPAAGATTAAPRAGDAAAAEPADGPDIAFAVQRIRIRDGSVRYHSAPDGASVRLEGWNQDLSLTGTVEGGELAAVTLIGWLAFDDIAAEYPGAVLPARDLSVRVTHDAALDLSEDRIEVRSLETTVDGITLAGSGVVTGANSGRPHVRLDLSADGLDASRLMAWVPDSLRALMALPDGRAVALAGSAAIRAAVDGTITPATLPAVDGLLTLDAVAVTVGPDALVDQLAGRVAFSLDSVVARLDGRALGRSFNAGVAVRDPAAPLAVIALSGEADLPRLVELGLAPDTLGLAGAVRADIRAQVPLLDPASARAQGTVDATGIELAALDPAVRVPTAVARFEGGRVRVAPLRVELGPDRAGIDIEVTADGWIPAAVDTAAPPPRVTVAMTAGTLDLDALLGPSPETSEGSGYPPALFARLRDVPVDGRSAEELAEELGIAVPPFPPVDARVEARIAELVKNGLRYTDMDALLLVTPFDATLERLRFGLMGGTVDVAGHIRPVPSDSGGAPIETRVLGRFALANVGAGPFFDLLTPFKDHLTGNLDMAGDVAFDLDRLALPVRSSLEAGGSIAIADGRLANWSVLQGVTDRLGIASLDTLRFRDWAGTFRVEGPRVTLDETALQGGALDARAGGWFDFGGTLDISATASLSPELAGRAGAVGGQLVAAIPGGRIPVGLRIHGPVEQPSVDLDLEPARQLAAGRARDAVDRAAEEARERARRAEQAAREAADEAVRTARDTARALAEAARDTVRQAAEDLAEEAVAEAVDVFELPDSLRDMPADSLRLILGDSVFATLPDSVKLRADSLQQAIENAIRERLRRLIPGGGDRGGGGDG